MATSFAVWVEDTDSNNTSEPNVSIEQLHFNFWCTKKPPINCIDIGIKFSLKHSAKGKLLNIYIPFAIEKERIEDLSEKMVENHDLIEAIFNDYILSFSNKKTKHVCLNLASKKEEKLILNTNIDFNDYDGKFDNRASVSTNGQYTIIKFSLEECILKNQNEHTDNLKYYIRLRLKNLKENELITIMHKMENSDKFLKPLKEQLMVIDFRINELRVLPKDIRISLANAHSYPEIYHLFIIRDETDEYQLSHSGNSYKKCRILEGETWKKYFDHNIFKNNQSSMIYHWNKECKKNSDDAHKLTDFIAVAKYKQIQTPILTIFIYIAVVIFIGIASCYIYDLLKPHLPYLS
ncbi:hypothetical protein RJE46_00220 [Cedecea neteri]|uniref:hypothetical protein n=1 Tax=Cedecea neteri TaxID=158822 RepID=UPI002892A2D9|nr:hypothetical protein [Cedecea neteri]WNJ79719.1 hypothetical protein RJE46_00220 [Cedecea neteri]